MRHALSPRKQGHGFGGKLDNQLTWLGSLLDHNGELTLDELCIELGKRGVHVHRATVGRALHRLGLSHKKRT